MPSALQERQVGVMDKAKHLIQVWDLPVRIFHWSLVLLVGLLFLTASIGALDLHGLAGESVLALVIFRLIWGVVGSQTARFIDFLGGAAAMWQYVRRRRSKSLGHNPIGGWMVVTLLAVLFAQACTGLLANDGILFQGPLAHLIIQEYSDAASTIHHALADMLGILIAVHVSAILLYWLLAKENLVAPMLTGKKWIAEYITSPQFANPARAIIILGYVLFAIGFLVTFL